jgi:polyisoprenoid-binding protein YceI
MSFYRCLLYQRNRLILNGKGETHEETFDVEFNGVSKNPMNGQQVTGFIVSGTINREKYGINFNQALETGGSLRKFSITNRLIVDAKFC